MDGSVAFRLAMGGVVIAVVGYFWWWCFRHWSRIWDEPRTAYEKIVFRQGARGWGFTMWLAVGVVFPLYDAVRAHHPWQRIVAQVGFEALIGFPMYLWFGYWWGRGMAAFFGVKDSARAV